MFIARAEYPDVIPGPASRTFVEYDRRFKLFGSHVRVLIGAPVRPGLPSPEAMGIQIEFFLRLLHRKLTRFDRGSELCALNAESGESCSVSPTVAVAVDAALWAARRSDGLVDPTLVGRAGGRRLRELARRTTPRRASPRPSSSPPSVIAATPRADARWRDVVGRRCRGTSSAGPPGVRIDTGGSGKGLAADLAAERLGGYSTFVVDAGGDLRIGGERPLERLVRIDHPLEDQPAHEFMLGPWRGGDQRHQDSPLAYRRWLRPPPARSVDRQARLDRA